MMEPKYYFWDALREKKIEGKPRRKSLKREIWKRIPNYRSYEVSNKGRIRRGSHIKVFDTTGNYVRVLLYNKDGVKRFMVKTLVADAFMKRRTGRRVIHRDMRRPLDCNVRNLREVRDGEVIPRGALNPDLIRPSSRRGSQKSTKKSGYIRHASTKQKRKT